MVCCSNSYCTLQHLHRLLWSLSKRSKNLEKVQELVQQSLLWKEGVDNKAREEKQDSELEIDKAGETVAN